MRFEIHMHFINLQGVDTLLRVPPSLLKQHGRSADEKWSAFYGKVYNITHYLPYHPGGEKELMRVAGRDGTKLFGMFRLLHCMDSLHLRARIRS